MVTTKLKRKLAFIVLGAIGGFSLFFTSGIAQENYYGLGFQSHDVVQDKRTSLELFPNTTFNPKSNFTLNFDLSFYKGHKIYFGYIFRIIKDETENIDFIYDERTTNPKHFRIVIGNNLTSIGFDIDSSRFNKWNSISVTFDPDRKKIKLLCGKNSYEQFLPTLKVNSHFKFFFGANQFQQFKVTDVPPMKLRNIQLFEGDRLKKNWPLNERSGNIAHEIIDETLNASVSNPIWIKNNHYEWKAFKSFTVKGKASVAFDADNKKLYVIGQSPLMVINFADNGITNFSKNSGIDALVGNQSLFGDGLLYNIYPDQRLISRYDFKEGNWSSGYKPDSVTSFWHFNKVYSSFDSSIYVFNGYGYLQYRNWIFKCGISSKKWMEIKPKGDFLVPRYLAASTINKRGDSIFILGGYGSPSGQQILNPKSLYDLMVYDVRNNHLKKMLELQPGNEDFVFANSMILDESDKFYYALAFSNYKYNTSLQLIKGNFKNGTYELLGSKIPYLFHDINSFADLYYCSALHLFVTATLLYNGDSNTTTVNVYTLSAPAVSEFDGVYVGAVSCGDGSHFAIIFSLIIAGLVIFTCFLFRKKIANFLLQRVFNKKGISRSAYQQKTDIDTASALTSAEVLNSGSSNNQVQLLQTPSGNKASIFLFGEIQIFDKHGSDITHLFTPLIKELFLIILLSSIRKKRGISSDRLNEIFWFDKDAKSARNNRSVNIAKLKTILDGLEYCQISKETGYWKIDIDYDRVYVDFYHYLQLVNNKKQLIINDIEKLSTIIQRGAFLTNIEHPWLDDFKSEVSNEIIDTYIHYASSINIKDDPETMIKITNYISYFDPVNEEAMIIRCRALSYLGKHSLAKSAYENFTREYWNIYGENFAKDFNSILE